MRSRRRTALAATLAILAAGGARAGAPMGAGQVTLAQGCRFPDAAFSVTSDRYLVVWVDYTKSPARVCGTFLDPAGERIGAELCISNPVAAGLMPAVAWSSRDDEFLVAYDSERGAGDRTFAQRIRASDGALLGSEIPVSPNIGIRPAVAYSAKSNVYYVAWYYVGSPAVDVFGARVGADGAVLEVANISSEPEYSGYPSVAWASSTDEFVVTWDREEGTGVFRIIAQRVSAASGALLGSKVALSTSGASDRSHLAFDPELNRFFVVWNEHSPGRSYDQYGRFLAADGALGDGPLAVAATADFEGDTLFGGDVAFAPFGGRYFASFETTAGHAGQELDAAGAAAAPLAAMGSGDDQALSNAVDPRRSRFLGIWESLVGSAHSVRMRLYQADDVRPPAPPTLSAGWEGEQARLEWVAPGSLDLAKVMVRVGAGAAPATPQEGELVVESGSQPGAPGTFSWAPSAGAGTFSFAAFAVDTAGNASQPAAATLVRAPPGEDGGPSEALDGGEPADGGAPGSEQTARGGCGCGAAPLSAALALALLLLAGVGGRPSTHSG